MSSTHLWSNVVTSVSGGGGGSYTYLPDYDATIDLYNMGQTYGAPRRDMVGGHYDNSTIAGSRSMMCNVYPYQLGDTLATRGCSKEYYPGGTVDMNERALVGGVYATKYDAPVYNSNIDSQSYGQSNCAMRRCLIGGGYNTNIYAGSRSESSNSFSTRTGFPMVARGCRIEVLSWVVECW